MPGRIRITFHKLIQDSQELGSDNEFMVSRLFFSVETDGAVYGNLCVNLKQTVGSDYMEENIEVGPPIGYNGPFNHEAFAEAARKYYLDWVGPGGRGIRIGAGAGFRGRNNTFTGDKSVEIPLP
jgi:hypothetical protein